MTLIDLFSSRKCIYKYLFIYFLRQTMYFKKIEENCFLNLMSDALCLLFSSTEEPKLVQCKSAFIFIFNPCLLKLFVLLEVHGSVLCLS